jgi:hypothetical protein
MRGRWAFLLLVFPVILFHVTGCADKRHTPVTDLSNTVLIDTFSYNQNQYSFFTTAILNDSLFCIYREYGSDSLIISAMNESGLGEKRLCFLKDTTFFSVQCDSVIGDKMFFQRSFLVNHDTIIFFNKGKFSGEVSSRILWYYIISRDSVVVVDRYDAPDYLKIESHEEVQELYHYTSRMEWNTEKGCLLSYFNYYGDLSSKTPFLMEIYPFDSLRKVIFDVPLPAAYDFAENEIFPFFDIVVPVIGSNGKMAVAFGVTSQIFEIENGKNIIHNVDHPNFSQPQKYSVTDIVHGAIGDDVVHVAETSFGYMNFLYDKYNDVYYRFYEMEMPDRAENGLKSTYPDDKPLGINVVSSDFSTVEETVVNSDDRSFFNNLSPKFVLPYGIVDVYFDYKTGNLVRKTLRIQLKKG